MPPPLLLKYLTPSQLVLILINIDSYSDKDSLSSITKDIKDNGTYSLIVYIQSRNSNLYENISKLRIKILEIKY